MKKSNFLSRLVLTAAMLLILHLQLKAQDFCHTVGGGAASIGAITGSNSNGNNSSAPAGPYYVRVYVHAIRHMDGSGGQTDEAIRNAFARLDADFNPHNIFFVRACDVIDVPVSEEDYFNFNIWCDLWANPQFQHDDGIDMFFGPDEVTNNAGGIAANIPSKALWVAGIWDVAVPVPVPALQSPVMSHEMGHCLGLWHTHHGTAPEGGEDCDGNDLSDPNDCCELVNGSNGNLCGDYVPDTDADPRLWAAFGVPDPCVNLNLYYSDNFPCMQYVSPTVTADENGDVYTPPTDNTMSYNQRLQCLTGFTTGQGDRMRQIISISPVLQACLVHADFTNPTITTNTTWTTANTPNNGDFLVSGDLEIESGATLTINAGVTVHFEEDSRLIIKPNGRLILRGTLTGMGCGHTWQGIEVWGNSNASQSGQNPPFNSVYAQGRLVTENGAVIENARTSAKLYGPNYALNAGGRITCRGTTFRNCTIGAEFAPYIWGSANYVGSFEKCTFVVDDDYPHGEPFYAFVHMTGVRGVGITGCSFNNNMNITGDDIADWGYGIYADDAGFNVGAKCEGNPVPYPLPCPGYTFSEFNNLGYGIYAAMIVTNRPYSVRQSNFNDCFVGIRNKSVSGGTILFNNFNLGTLPSAAFTQQQIGVSFETGITGFTFQENDFIGDPNSSIETIGSACKNTGNANKTVRKNRYTNLTIGNLANGQNASTSQIMGLDYDCNRNTNVFSDGYDFDVPNGNIRSKQGLIVPGQSSLNAAGNRFSYTGTDFANSGAGIEYFFNQQGVNEPPITFSGNFTPMIAQANTCPTIYCEPPCHTEGEIEIIKSEFYTVRNQYLTAKADYDAQPTEPKLVQMGAYRKEMDDNAYMVVLHELYDTLDFNEDTLLVWVENQNSLAADLWRSSEQLANGNPTLANQILDAAPLKFDLTGEQQTDVDNYQAIANLIGSQWAYSLSEASLQSIKAFDNDGGNAEGWAQNILTHFGAHYPPIYETSRGSGERSSDGRPETGNSENERNLPHISVQPNPAGSHATFILNLPADVGAVMIRVRDSNGRLVAEIEALAPVPAIEWDTQGSPSGVYFFQLTTDSAIRETGKIILNK